MRGAPLGSLLGTPCAVFYTEPKIKALMVRCFSKRSRSHHSNEMKNVRQFGLMIMSHDRALIIKGLPVLVGFSLEARLSTLRC